MMTDEELRALEEQLVRELTVAEAMNRAVCAKAQRIRVERERRAGGTVHEFRPRPSGTGSVTGS